MDKTIAKKKKKKLLRHYPPLSISMLTLNDQVTLLNMKSCSLNTHLIVISLLMEEWTLPFRWFLRRSTSWHWWECAFIIWRGMMASQRRCFSQCMCLHRELLINFSVTFLFSILLIHPVPPPKMMVSLQLKTMEIYFINHLTKYPDINIAFSHLTLDIESGAS